MDFSLIDALNNIITFATKSLGSNLFEKTKNLISGIEPLIRAGLGTYFLLCVLDYYRNGVQDTVIDMTKKFTGWILLTALVLNAGHYLELSKLIYEAPEQFAELIGDNKKFDGNIFKGMMSDVDLISAKIDEFMSQHSWYQLGPLITGLLAKLFIYLGVAIIAAIAIIYYIIAKVCLALILLVGPLFLSAMFFPATRQYGMNWIGQSFNYIITVMLYVAINTIMTNFITNQMGILSKATINVPVLMEITAIMIPLTAVFVLVIFSVPSIASALTGGATLELNTRKGAVIGKPFGAAAKAAGVKTGSMAIKGGKWAIGKALGGNSNKIGAK